MTAPKSDFLRVLTERGYIHQCSDLPGLDEKAAAGQLTAYVGYDCTGPSLHVGHLLSIMMLHWFQQTGHRPIALMGGGTTRVGDPSGKDESRKILTLDQIEENKQSLRTVFSRFIDFDQGSSGAGAAPHGQSGAEAAPHGAGKGAAAFMVDNAEWLSPLNYIDFLRDVGKHFSVNRMLSFDSVKTRLEREHELSFLEFNYMILQAYDFVELSKRHGCVLQMGGSDQWGNIINGIDLGRRMGQPQLYALTCPLITTSSGAKMGKTANGAVWLKGDMRSPYEYWQFWRNTEDADVERFLKLFTILPLEEIARLAALGGSEVNEAKKILATEATTLLHGRDVAQQAAETARKTFEEGALAEDLPSVTLPVADLKAGIGVLSAFANAGLVASTSEARRQVKGGGLRVNDVVVSDDRASISESDLTGEGVIKLSFGRKKHVLLRFS